MKFHLLQEAIFAGMVAKYVVAIAAVLLVVAIYFFVKMIKKLKKLYITSKTNNTKVDITDEIVFLVVLSTVIFFLVFCIGKFFTIKFG